MTFDTSPRETDTSSKARALPWTRWGRRLQTPLLKSCYIERLRTDFFETQGWNQIHPLGFDAAREIPSAAWQGFNPSLTML